MKEEMRARLERLLGGDFRVDDVKELILWLRDQRAGKDDNLVREIGDFFAHRSLRCKGLSTEITGDFLTFVRYWIRAQGKRDFSDLPANMPQVLKAALKRARDDELRRETGLVRKAATRTLAGLIATGIKTDGTTSHVCRFLGYEEYRLLDFLTRHLRMIPVIKQRDVFARIERALIGSGLLTPKEYDAFRDAEHFVTLCIVAAMHGSAFVLDDNSQSNVRAGVWYEGTIAVAVSGEFELAQKPGEFASIVTPMFVTDLRPENSCAPGLLSAISWEGAIEVDRTGKLSKLGAW